MTAVAGARPSKVHGPQARLVAEIAHARALLEAYGRGEPPPTVAPKTAAPEMPVDRLAGVLGLSPFERQVLLLVAAVELDGEVAALSAEVQGGADPRPTFALALSALPDPHWDALAPGSPLRWWRLVELGSGPTLAARPLRLDERVLHHLTGIPSPDDRLDGIVSHPSADAPLAPSQVDLVEELASVAGAVESPLLVSLDGDDIQGRLAVARHLAAATGRRALVVRADALPPPGPELAATARLIERELLLLDAWPVVDSRGKADAAAALADLLHVPVTMVLGALREPPADRLSLTRSVRLPDPAAQRALWAAALGEAATPTLAPTVEEVAQHYRLGAAAIGAVAREMAAGAPTAARLRTLCRERARAGLDGLAQRIEPCATWDDLVLPQAQTELLGDIARHVRHRTQVYERWGFGARTSRGLGVTALFSGESGTGKTLAAEILAGDLGLDLYRVDLATTVSKYIGETEKNLRALFDGAEASGAVLLFDEADALFGKRGEVKDSHDRYANLEVAYLLQRMESYRGLAILTTNLRSNVDRAFLRRLRFVVQFPFPDEKQRALIWRLSFPPEAPLEGIDFDQLARLTVPGGSIQAIALSAAFAAAEDGTPVTPAHVLRGARIEYAKAERSLTAAETGGLA